MPVVGRAAGGSMRWLARAALAALVAFAAPAQATFHTFRIDELFSTADGAVQFIVLKESENLAGQNHLTGVALTVGRATFTKTYVFPNDLTDAATAGRSVLIATVGYAALRTRHPEYALPAADYTVEDRFLPVDGGTLDYGGADVFTYSLLPTNGSDALFRTIGTRANRATNYAGATATLPPVPVAAVEFYNATLDHYFVSPLAPDIDALDSGRIAGWGRTGLQFFVYPYAASLPGGGAAVPVCRFYIPPEHGNSHFFSASAAECSTILSLSGSDPNYSGYVYETPQAFFVPLPDGGTGACPASAPVAVYRLWNQRVDSNHRYTADRAVKDLMVSRGSVAEGYGPDAVAMCATTN
jgi:hypothetical protein